jgi:hypothetical protein
MKAERTSMLEATRVVNFIIPIAAVYYFLESDFAVVLSDVNVIEKCDFQVQVIRAIRVVIFGLESNVTASYIEARCLTSVRITAEVLDGSDSWVRVNIFAVVKTVTLWSGW